jgi:KaiC/GvpD/RAD55 family RecA-like ATPase
MEKKETKGDSKRVPSGIEGFDEISGGGLQRDRSYLLSGPSGVGKTIFGLQYLYNGIIENGENGIIISTEDRPDRVRENALKFGWDFEGLEDEGKLAIIDACSTKIGIPSHEKYVDVRPFDLRSMMDQIIAAQDAIDAKRALIDSTTTIGFYLQDPAKIRIELLKFAKSLDVLGLTSILTCELLEDAIGNSRFGVEQFITDGIIRLNSKRDGDAFYKEISIIKMRGSQHSNNIHPFVITPKGIVVQVKQSENLE